MEDTETNELQDLLGVKLYNDVILYPDKATNKRLIDGLTWECDSTELKMNGLSYVLAWYFYANYIYESDIQDTFSGAVIHNFDESRQADKSRKDKYTKRARETAGKYWSEVELYLDNNSNDYPLWNCASKRKVFKPFIRRLNRPIMNTDFYAERPVKITTQTNNDDVDKIEVEGQETLSAGVDIEMIFSSNLGTINYQLSFQAWDSDGQQVFPTLHLPLQEDKIVFDLPVDATVSYKATKL